MILATFAHLLLGEIWGKSTVCENSLTGVGLTHVSGIFFFQFASDVDG